MMKREACFGKKVPLPGNREGHGVSKAIHAVAWCAVSFRLTFGQTVKVL